MAQTTTNTKLGSNGLGIVAVVSAIYCLLAAFLPSLSGLLWLVAVIMAFMAVSKLKKSGSKQMSPANKIQAIWYLAFSPVLVQCFYYYRLRSQSPALASSYNKLGWKVLGWEFLFTIILAVIISAIHNPK